MEDTMSVEIGFVAKERGKCDVFTVYDGHDGAQVAEACWERLHRLVVEEVERSGGHMELDWEGVMQRVFS
uniref:PPM-type phosphatase domain-containing protein n=1 Tax=Cajanus cajan TaxID=3821 RepID=A0A151SX45_CAJCA|nr:putative protein phosphatase 2C 68 [Cajanus cajan]